MEPEFRIYLTTDQKTVEQCARMMAGTDPWVKLGIDYEKCLVAFEGPCKEIYGVHVNDELAGFAILQICGSFKGYIQTICIKHNYRGQRLGTRILHFCEERILKISPNIFICVSSFNTGALRLYQSFGFKLVGELENFVKEGYSELLLRKTVGAINGYKTS
jgi:[ribosomal protein S18]-alanine N-acetyltransferase